MSYSFLDNVTVSSFFIKKSSFLKRFFIVCLAVIVAFNTSFGKPKQTYALATEIIVALIAAGAAVSAAVVGTTASHVLDWWAENKESSEGDIETYGTQHISVDGDGNYVLDDSMLQIANEYKLYCESEVEYINLYGVSSISASLFDRAEPYNFCCDLINAHPEYNFFIYRNENSYLGIYNTFLAFTDKNIAGLYSDADTIFDWETAVTLYNLDTWEVLSRDDFYFIGFSTINGMVTANYIDVNGAIQQDALLQVGDYNDVSSKIMPGYQARGYTNHTFINEGVNIVNSFTLFTTKTPTVITGNYTQEGPHALINSNNGAIPCFASLQALKMGTTNTKGITPTDSYPGYGVPVTNNFIPKNSIEITVPGSGGSDDSDENDNPSGGSDGDGDNEVTNNSGIGKALSSLINAIFSPFTSAINSVTSKIQSITGTVNSIVSSVTSLFTTNGFLMILGSVFPFIPQEWITLISLALSLPLLGVLVRFLFSLFGK